MKLTRRDRRVAAAREPVRTAGRGRGTMIGRFSLCRVILFFFSLFFFYHTWWCISSVVCLVTISLRRILFYVGTSIHIGRWVTRVYIPFGLCRYIRTSRRSHRATAAAAAAHNGPQPSRWPFGAGRYITILNIYTQTKERRKRKNKNRLLSLYSLTSALTQYQSDN